jgi:hypothetical protein
VWQVFLQAAQARHTPYRGRERSPLVGSEPTRGLESNQACALLNDASGVMLCLGTVGFEWG